jgi:hypothetical protein
MNYRRTPPRGGARPYLEGLQQVIPVWYAMLGSLAQDGIPTGRLDRTGASVDGGPFPVFAD